MELLAPIVLGVLVIVAVNSFAPRVGVAVPLLLVLIGIGVGVLPFVPDVHVEPDLVLELVLPVLLYSSAVTVPAMDFRRDLRIISGLSVVLVVASAVGVGALLAALVPGVGLATGIAVGAVVSPTDAVATSIVRKAGLSPRVVTVLDGEAMLNDASALVLLRSAIAATATAVSLWHVAGTFVWSVVVAAVLGWAVGRANLVVRRRLGHPAAGVAVSAVGPFVASVPAERFGASGLVAAVAAGLVVGHGSPRYLSAEDRMSERAVWRTVELVAEGAVFLLMGLQASGLLHDVRTEHESARVALGLGALVATTIVAVRAAFVAPSLWGLDRRRRRGEGDRERLAAIAAQITGGTLPVPPARPGHEEKQARRTADRLNRMQQMIERRGADLDYLAAQRLGRREGVVLVWAGMRGAVTVAAAQSLPSSTPSRSLLVLVSFTVAAGTLLVQGATLPAVVRRLGVDGRTDDSAERAALRVDLITAGAQRLQEPALRRPDGSPFSAEVLERVRSQFEPMQQGLLDPDPATVAVRAEYKDLRRALIEAERDELVRLRDVGTYPSAMLDEALVQLDADQLGLEMR